MPHNFAVGKVGMNDRPTQQACPMCGHASAAGGLYEYSRCSHCGSYSYRSDQTAEEDNRYFYDHVYSDDGRLRSDRLKKKLFRWFARRDRKRFNADYAELDRVRKEADDVQSGKKIVEIGFGEGRHLLRLLESGEDARGIDISEQVVTAFCRKYPRYRDRVRVGTEIAEPADVVYCSALLEHLDDPRDFIQKASSCLASGGFLIVNAIPIVNPQSSDIKVNHDISFWKPCHRIIPSHHGMKTLFDKLSFDLKSHAVLDVFNYRLLSLHNREGFSEIVNLRNTCLRHKQLPDFLKYLTLCREAQHVKSCALLGLYIFVKR